MRDGVKLATDVYLPAATPPFPVILMRSPYNRTNTGGVGPNGTQMGYAVVVQDTRGRFASEGENLPFHLDATDGQDTVAWIHTQGWCNGRVGTMGGSALGITQLQLAGTGTELACQHIAVAGPRLYGDVVYVGGVFRKSLAEDWLRASKFSPKALDVWTGHSIYDLYWAERDVSRRYRKANAPALHLGGFYDIFAQGTIDAFLGFQTKGGPRARGHQKLLMGPWTHGVLTDKAGELTFPNAKRPPNDVHDPLRWMACYLKDAPNGLADLPPVTYYVMGDVMDTNAPGNEWRTAATWPPLPTTATRFYLQPDHALARTRPHGSRSLSYAYDPKDPAPTIGGYELTLPAGPRDQQVVEQRSDVLVFTSEPLSAPLEVIGNVTARIYVASDAPDTDFLVRLCDVYPDGRSFNICETIQRARFRESPLTEVPLKPGKIYGLNLSLWTTSIVFNKGHRLRVHVTSSSAPAYDPNPNTGEPFRSSERTRIARNTVYVSHAYPSRVVLPVVTGKTPR